MKVIIDGEKGKRTLDDLDSGVLFVHDGDLFLKVKDGQMRITINEDIRGQYYPIYDSDFHRCVHIETGRTVWIKRNSEVRLVKTLSVEVE